jgi:uncharacterized protein (DUF2249 family)
MTISENTKTMETENLIDDNRVMDVRPIPCSIKHGLILKTWRELALNSYFILLNDHDPVPLRYQFTAEFPGAFTWEYLEKGPRDFRVKITKVQAIPTDSVNASPAGYGCSAEN